MRLIVVLTVNLFQLLKCVILSERIVLWNHWKSVVKNKFKGKLYSILYPISLLKIFPNKNNCF